MTIILYIFGGLLYVFLGILVEITAIFSAAIPTEFTDSLTYFFGFLANQQGNYNILDTMTAIVWFISFLYVFFLYLAVKHFIPGGKKEKIFSDPREHEFAAQGRLYNLRTRGKYRLP